MPPFSSYPAPDSPEPREPPRLTRRDLLAAAATVLATPAAAEPEPKPEKLALPGPYRGRVVEVFHPRSVTSGRVERATVRAMMERGMRELTGAKSEVEAWKQFFAPGDRVAVKVCPVGKPRAISQPETLLEVVRGLNLAGVPNRNIILFDRYRQDMLQGGFVKLLPPGVRWGFGSAEFDQVQTGLEGYDPETWVEMPRVMTGQDPKNPAARRSSLCNIVSKQADKVINVCCLKDHASAGITMALKNISHGFVNNVIRSHASASVNWCDTFIPTVVGMPKIREKVVLHIGDGLIGTYDGGPGRWAKHFRTWEYRSLFLSTDPVAMDRVGWAILDRKRAEMRLPPLAETGLKLKNPGYERFDVRQPQHVLIAGEKGLGEADLARIEHRKVKVES